MKKETLQGIIQETWKQMTEEEVVKKILKNKVHEQTISAHLYCKLQHDEELMVGISMRNTTGKEQIEMQKQIKWEENTPRYYHTQGWRTEKHNNLLWIEMKSGTFAKEGKSIELKKLRKI